jgi:hypothetical protein
MRKSTLGVLLSLLLVAWPALAQDQRGSIQGIVKDNSGAVLPGVTVEAKSSAGGTVATTTDANGSYRFPSLAPGTYEVTASLQGFSTAKLGSILLTVGQIKTVELALGVGGLAEKVQVTAEAPLIDIKQSGRATSIRAEQIELLPHDRNFTSLVVQAPGANNEPKSGGIMIDGSSASENRYIVDGMETTEMVHGTSGKNLIADFVEEVQVKSSGYTAEYGGSTGGVINVITKSGSNQLSGSAFTYWQGSSLRGANSQTLRLNPTNSSLAEYITYPKDDSSRVEPAIGIGGPLLKDKAWFFGAYQPALTSIDRTVTLRATGSPITINQKQNVQYITANQTSQISDKLRTRVAYNNSWSKQTHLLPSLDGSDADGTNYDKTTAQPNYTLSGNADYIISPKFFIGFRAGYFSSDTHDSGVPTVSRYLFGTTTNIGLAGVPADLQRATNFSSILSNSATSQDALKRTYFQLDGTWYGHAGGDHQLKFGTQYDRRSEDILSGELGHRVTINWDRPLSSGVPLTRGTYGYYSVRSNAVAPGQGLITQGDVKSNLIGFFVQDAWTIGSRLTINAGVRTENEKVPSYTTGAGIPVNPISFGFGDKFAPRVGFAYDLRGDGKWKLAADWGLFYDIFKLELPQGSFGGQKWLEYYYTLDTPNWPTLDQGSGCPPACSGTLIRGPIDFRQPSFGADALEPDLKPMRQQAATISLERQLSAVMAVSARYVHKNVDRAIEDTGSQDAAGNETYIIANPGEGLTQLAFTDPTVNLPKPQRKYDGIEFVFDKRLANNWQFRASYLYSRDYGNYPGLSESDENGRTDPNVGRLYDYPLIMFRGDGTPSYGVLPTDRPNQVKLNFLYQFKFGTSVGINQYAYSGLPITREAAVLPGSNYPVQYLGRGSDGRTDVLTNTDLFIQHDFKLGGRKMLSVNINVLNLFNQQASISAFSTMFANGALTFNQADFYNHALNFDSLIAAQASTGAVTLDPRFLKDSAFQDPRQARVGVRFSF